MSRRGDSVRDSHLGPPRPGDAPESGTALPLVLITIAMLALVVATVTSGSAQELRMSRAFVHSNQAYDAALAGIQQLAARCASVGPQDAACHGSSSPLATFHGRLDSDKTAYQVGFAPCGGTCSNQADVTAISVLSIGCTVTQSPGNGNPCDNVTSDQGRRVIQATLFVRNPPSGTRQVWFQLQP